MSVHSVDEAQNNLQQLMHEAVESHRPVVITGKDGDGKSNNVVLLAEEDWASIQETLYLLSVPGMRESIKSGLATPIDDCDKALPW